MDYNKVGALISSMRKEKGYTQKQLSEYIHVSDKAVSKWERAQGCPDVSLLRELSEILGINIEKILTGELEPNSADGGNMKRIKFYICPECGNIMTATGEAEVACCGRKLTPQTPQKADEAHRLSVEETGDEFYITFDHEMEKQHYLNFVAYVNYNSIHLVRLYPEQNGEARMPGMRGGRFYYGCSRDGVWVSDGRPGAALHN